MSKPSCVVSAFLLAAALILAACSDDPEAAADDPLDGFCRGIVDADAALRDLSEETEPTTGLRAAQDHLVGVPSGTFRDQATLVLRRLEIVAQVGVGPVSGAEQIELRSALSSVSSECNVARSFG